MNDIESRADIEVLMKTFYTAMLQDDLLGPVFTEVAKIDLDEHLPILADFWESILFDRPVYSRNTMQPHLHLHARTPLHKAHFDRWLHYFNQALDTLFAGPKATLAKQRALSVATVMQIKIAQQP
jgi:hemoglobin